MSHKITMFDIQQLMTSPKWFSDAAKTNFLNVAQYTYIYHYLYIICILLQWKLQKKKIYCVWQIGLPFQYIFNNNNINK